MLATPQLEHAAIAPVRVAHTIRSVPPIQRSHWALVHMHHYDCVAMSFTLQPPPLQRQKSTAAAPIGSHPSETACRATSRTLPSRARPRIQDLQCRTLPRRISVSTCANILDRKNAGGSTNNPMCERFVFTTASACTQPRTPGSCAFVIIRDSLVQPPLRPGDQRTTRTHNPPYEDP